MEKENIIMQYISAWNWQIISLISLSTSFIIFSSNEEISGTILFFAFLVGFAICQSISYTRRAKLENKNE